jgi:hypothetical protein
VCANTHSTHAHKYTAHNGLMYGDARKKMNEARRASATLLPYYVAAAAAVGDK